MNRPIESDYTSQVAYTRALEAYCDSLPQLEQPAQQEPRIDIYRSFEQWKSGNVLEHGVPRTEFYTKADLDLVEMGWRYGYDAGRAVEQALDRKAENARELGLDYEPDIPFGDNNPGLPWDEVPQAFNDWWNADYDPTGNPFEKDTHAYWAWAGWKAAEQPAQPEPMHPEIKKMYEDYFDECFREFSTQCKPLTEGEIERMWFQQADIPTAGQRIVGFARAIEAKLKEKNNGN